MSDTNETAQAEPQAGQPGRGDLAEFVARGQSAQHAVNEAGADVPAQETPASIGAKPFYKPSVGRIVHFKTPENAAIPGVTSDMPFAAIVTRVHSDEIVDLTVFLPSGATHGFSSAVHGEHWHWPPRVV